MVARGETPRGHRPNRTSDREGRPVQTTRRISSRRMAIAVADTPKRPRKGTNSRILATGRHERWPREQTRRDALRARRVIWPFISRKTEVLEVVIGEALVGDPCSTRNILRKNHGCPSASQPRGEPLRVRSTTGCPASRSADRRDCHEPEQAKGECSGARSQCERVTLEVRWKRTAHANDLRLTVRSHRHPTPPTSTIFGRRTSVESLDVPSDGSDCRDMRGQRPLVRLPSAARDCRRRAAGVEVSLVRPDSLVASYYEQPLVPPQVMHLRQVPLRTSVKWSQLPQASPV